MGRARPKLTLAEIVEALGATSIDDYPTAAAARAAGEFVAEMRRLQLPGVPAEKRREWRGDGSALPTTGPRDPGVGASPDEE